MTLRALVVGTGFGCRVHVPALRAAGFKVVGLVGTNAEKLAKRAKAADVPAVFTDLDKAIAATGATVVSIATPPVTHAQLAGMAIARGCHVLLEKPFTTDAAQARELLARAEAAGIVHAVAHEFRWAADRRMFGRAIAEGLIGEPRLFVMNQMVPMVADPEARMPGWWFDKVSGGGWLGASGSHLIDQIRVWLGEFRSLSANAFVVSDRGDVADDSFALRFQLANGAEGVLQNSAGAWGPPVTLLRCAGTRGTVWMDAGKVMLADRSGTRELDVPDDMKLPPAPGQDPGLPPFIRLCEAFRAAIEGRAISPLLPTFRDGLAGMAIIDAIRASAASRAALQTV